LQLPQKPENTDTEKSKQSTHFTRFFTSDEQKKLFDGLTNGGYLPKDTDYNHFCHVFGDTAISDNGKPFEPLRWIGTLKELNCFVNIYFNNEQKKWEKTIKCFLWNNEIIKKQSLSTAIDKYDTEPERKPYLESLLI
jgi:hypothetical protein